MYPGACSEHHSTWRDLRCGGEPSVGRRSVYIPPRGRRARPTDIRAEIAGRCLSAPSEPLWRCPWLESERRRPPSTAAHSSVINPSQASIATIVTNLKLCGDHAGSAREAAASTPVHGHASRFPRAA